ncbi:MAG TPA: hypothetical protein VF170_11860, partial [Planctomycetaceae bacterium]
MPPYPNDRPSSPRQGCLLLPDGFDRDSGFGPSAFADIDSEESLVACVLKDATILDGPAGNLSPSDFCDTVCGNAHTAALAVRDASGVGAVNIVSVTEEMNRRTGHPQGTISGELLRICRRVYLVKEADRYVARIGGAAEGRRLDAAYRESLAANADPTLDADEVTAALLARLGDEVDHPPPFCLLDSAASDDARFETEYLIEEVLVRGQPAVWAASMKGCKTITAVALGVHGATGTPLFGYARFAVPKPFRTAIV